MTAWDLEKSVILVSHVSYLMSSPRDLTGDEARQLIDDILARTVDHFILHLSWKDLSPPQSPDAEKTPLKIEQHLSFHGTWTAQEILATGKGRNRQLEEIIVRGMGKKGG